MGNVPFKNLLKGARSGPVQPRGSSPARIEAAPQQPNRGKKRVLWMKNKLSKLL